MVEVNEKRCIMCSDIKEGEMKNREPGMCNRLEGTSRCQKRREAGGCTQEDLLTCRRSKGKPYSPWQQDSPVRSAASDAATAQSE